MSGVRERQWLWRAQTWSSSSLSRAASPIVNSLLTEEAQGGAGDPAASEPAATDTLAPAEAPTPAENPAAADTTPAAPQPESQAPDMKTDLTGLFTEKPQSGRSLWVSDTITS
ncbi:unnamed protein product [Oncorhynchus mykiss]|uniref:Uncharacterized protein n=1 Tax=Oncorhynchus mykiss TaxID=8022 RepID=A0A060WJX4_ONCMY|nr:unnamed protein product [Oncorhynchus mykiss]